MDYHKNFRPLWLALCIVAIVTSCTKDEAYDNLTKKNGIDWTIGISKEGLTLPLGSTDKISLSEMLKTEGSENLSVNNQGQFYIEKDGPMGETSYVIDEISIDMNPVIEPRTCQIFLDRNWPEDVQAWLDAQEEGASLDALDETVLMGHPIVTENIFVGDEVECTEFVLHSEGVDPSLMDLHKATFRDDSRATFSLELSNLPNAEEEYSVTLYDVSIVLPYYINLVHAGTGVPYSNGTIADLGDNGTITLTKPAGSNSVSWTSHEFLLHSFALREDDMLHNDNGTLHRADTLLLFAKTEISRLSTRASDLKAGPLVNGHRTAEFKNKMVVNTSMDISPCVLQSADGRFNPIIDDCFTTEPIKLGEDVEFLREKGAVLDFKNLSFTANLVNPCQAKLLAGIEVDSRNGFMVSYKDVTILPSTPEEKFSIHFTSLDSDPANNIYADPNLSRLMQPIPDSIDVHLFARVDTLGHYQLEIGKPYLISGDYNLRVPFDFNEINLTYDEAYEDVFGEDISKYVNEINDATLSFSANNAVPLDIVLTVVGIDREGNEDASLIQHTPVTVKAGSVDAPVSTPVHLDINMPDVSAVRDLVIRMQISGKGCDLNSNQYLELEDVHITLRDLAIDLNEKE